MKGLYILLVLVLAAIAIPSSSLGRRISAQDAKVGAAAEPAKRGTVGVVGTGQPAGNPVTTQDPIKSKMIRVKPRGGNLLDKPTFGEKF